MMYPWDNYPHIWRSKSSFMSWLRGGIRRSLWSRSPIKLEFIKKNRKTIENPKKGNRNKPQVWGATCCICGKDYVLKDIEVDHKVGNHSLKEISDIESFIMSIVMVSENDLQLICKSCHKIKTHAEKNGISFEEAVKEKKLIAYGKLKTDEQIKILESYGKPSTSLIVRKKSFMEIVDILPFI
jgi:5-methylcytosine-specific restriction endonuclease McrA